MCWELSAHQFLSNFTSNFNFKGSWSSVLEFEVAAVLNPGLWHGEMLNNVIYTETNLAHVFLFDLYWSSKWAIVWLVFLSFLFVFIPCLMYLSSLFSVSPCWPRNSTKSPLCSFHFHFSSSSLSLSVLSQPVTLQLSRLMSSPWVNLTPVDNTAKTYYTWHSNKDARGTSLQARYYSQRSAFKKFAIALQVVLRGFYPCKLAAWHLALWRTTLSKTIQIIQPVLHTVNILCVEWKCLCWCLWSFGRNKNVGIALHWDVFRRSLSAAC